MHGQDSNDPFMTGLHDLTLELTLHNISINPTTMDRPADGTIFKSNHLGELVDVCSKLIINLDKAAETYCHT